MPDPAHDLLRDRWDEVDRLFGEALALTDEERQPFLERACEGDPGLLDTVSRLLAASVREGASLDGPGTHLLRAAFGSSPEREEAALGPGAAVDRYRLVREIGRGGMATVYQAERADGAFEGRVAIKILRGIDSHDVADRLVAERRILSSLTHPHIARLLDGGTAEDGRPFLVMELVEGEPITEWADRRRLDTRGRLQLFLQVVDAVQYAHTHLVVHRDIKPSNVLVGQDGAVRLLDFGIAKLLDADDAGLTRPATRWMTPEYASPEQILGHPVTTATDIHALGALLYELLGGHRPFARDGRAGFELQRAICEEVPDAVSAAVRRASSGRGLTPQRIAEARSTPTDKLQRRLSGDLDAIVARCLRKAPEDRYRSAQELHDDLRRHLTGFPVRALEGHRAYRVRKFLTRHRVGVSAAGLVALVMLAAGVALARQQAETLAQRDLAEAAAARAETEAENARLVIGFLADVFRGRDPGQAPSDTITARELLSWGVERVGTEFADRPAVQSELLLVLGDASANLGLMEEGAALAQRAVDVSRRAFGARSSQEADGLTRLGHLLRSQRNFTDAEIAYREALSIRDAAGPDDPGLAGPLTGLGQTLVGLRQFDSAVVLLRRAAALEAGGTGRERSLVPSLQLAYALRGVGRLAEARAIYEEAIPAYRALPDHDEGELAIYLNNLGYLRRVEGDPDAAIQAYSEALDIQVRRLGRGHPNTVLVADNLAGAYSQGGRDEEALEVLRETLAASETQYPEGHWRLGAAQRSMGDQLLRLGRLDEAREHLQAAASEFERQLGAQHDWTTFAYARVAVIRVLRGDSLPGRAFLDRLHGYLAGQELGAGSVNLLEQFLFVLRATGLASEYERFRAVHPDSVAADARGGP